MVIGDITNHSLRLNVNLMLSNIIFVRTHELQVTHRMHDSVIMYLLKIGVSRITPGNPNQGRIQDF